MNNDTVYTKVEVVRNLKKGPTHITPFYLRTEKYENCKLQIIGSSMIITTQYESDIPKHKVIPMKRVAEFYLFEK